MNDIIFSNSFFFRNIKFGNNHYTDNRCGAPSHYFALLTHGNCKIVTDSETIQINEGDIFYIPNKCPYQSFWSSKHKIEIISLGFLNLPNFDNKTYPVQVIPCKDKEAFKIFDELSNISHLNAYCIGRFYTLIGILMPLMKSKSLSRSTQIVNDAIKFLSENPNAKVSEIAMHCMVSEAYLYVAFQKSYDITLNQTRNRIILEKAKDMLITTDKPIEYISDFLNFSSASYFRKKFKNYFNMQPKEMRNKYRI